MAEDKPLEDVMHEATEAGEGDKVKLGDLLDHYDDRSFGPIFVLLGLIVVVPPIGAIPGLPAAVGAVLLLFSLQMLVGRDHVWVPGFLENLSMSRDKLETAEKKSGPWLYKADSLIADRLEWATSAPTRYIAAGLVTLMALALIPLELVPFAVALPGVAITLVGVAIMARDGVLMILAFALSAAAIFVLLRYSPILEWIGLGGAAASGG